MSKLEQDQHEKIAGADHVEIGDLPEKRRDNVDGDLGADFLANYHGATEDIDAESAERVRWKIDKNLLPLICIIYWCQQLDKSTLSFASVFNLSVDANLQGQEYSWLSSIVYFAQLVCQPLSVYALVVCPVNYWISGCFLCWGASLCIMTSFRSFAGLAAFRFILGGFEASIAPSMLIVVSMWWTRREQILRNNIWYSTNGLATILGSLLAYGLAKIQSDTLKQYQVIFLACGLISVACSLPMFFLFPRHPTRARFLSDEDRYIALERIRLNNTGTQNTNFKWSHVREAVLDPKSWMFVLMIFCISLVSGGIGTFGPLILKSFGLDSFQSILYNMIPGAIGITSNIISALVVQRLKRKSPVIFVASLFPLAAAAALYALPRGDQYRQTLLAVYFILQVFQCITPLIFSWVFSNTAGHTKKATITGMMYIGLCVGNIVGPQLYKTTEAPYYQTGLTGNLGVLCALTGLITLQTFYLAILNKRNAKRRAARGHTAEVVDFSLESSSKWAGLKAVQQERDAAAGHVEQHNVNAFRDLTDLENDEFIYSL